MRVVRSVVSAGAVAVLAVSSAGAAQAEQTPDEAQPMGNCDAWGPIELCGKITNDTNRPLRIGNDWCGDSNAPSVGSPSCGGDGSGNGYRWLQPGETSTVYFKDTDTFGVIKGCVISGLWDAWVPSSAFAYAPPENTWFKIYNGMHVQVTGYAC
ncbi:hypothetical protein J0910_30860 [Nocardiopsis sp. CNT-189]|uniref:hypothetical protein n=1 Tax=Nocardiopsis oceanisediminis TaxID=2816862 RepID=UPI003B316B54